MVMTVSTTTMTTITILYWLCNMLQDDVYLCFSVHKMNIVLYCISTKTTAVVTMSLEVGKYSIIISHWLADKPCRLQCVCVCVCGGSKSWWQRCTEQCFPVPVDNSWGCQDMLYTDVGHQDGLGSAWQECWWKQATSWGNCLSTQGLHISSFRTTAAVFTTVQSLLLPVLSVSLSVCTSFGQSICLPVCLSVCLAHLSTVSQLLNVSSISFHCLLAHHLLLPHRILWWNFGVQIQVSTKIIAVF